MVRTEIQCTILASCQLAVQSNSVNGVKCNFSEIIMTGYFWRKIFSI